MGRQHVPPHLGVEAQSAAPSSKQGDDAGGTTRPPCESASGEFLRYLGALAAGDEESPAGMERIKSLRSSASRNRYEQLSEQHSGTDDSDDSWSESRSREDEEERRAGGEARFLPNSSDKSGGGGGQQEREAPAAAAAVGNGGDDGRYRTKWLAAVDKHSSNGNGRPAEEAVSSPRVSFSPPPRGGTGGAAAATAPASPASDEQGKQRIWRESSYDFGHEPPEPELLMLSNGRGASEAEAAAADMAGSVKRRTKSFDFGVGAVGQPQLAAQQDPTSRVIGEFLRRQKVSGDLSLDYDPDMEELAPDWAARAVPVARTLSAVPEAAERPSVQQQPPPLEHRVDVREYPDSPAFLSPGEMRDAVGASDSSSTAIQDARAEVEKDNLAMGTGAGAGSSVLSATAHARTPAASSGVVKAPNQFYTVAKLTTRLRTRSRLADPPLIFSGASPDAASWSASLPPKIPGGGGGGGLPPKSGQAAPASARSGQLKSCAQKGQVNLKSGMQGTKRSGLLGKVAEEDEDDPFKDADLPDKYRKRSKLGFWTLFQWVAFFVSIGALVCSLTVPTLRHKDWLGLQLWKWSLVVLVIFCGRLISGWLIMLAVFFVERNFLLRKKVLYFVYGLRKGVQNCLWVGWILLAWHFILDPNVSLSSGNAKVLKYVTRVLVCLLICALLVLVKTFLLKILASSFHVAHYFERIQDSLFNQYVLETLSGPPLVEIEEAENEERRLMEEVADLKKAGARASGIPELNNAAGSASNNNIGNVNVSQPFAKTAMLGKSRRFSTGVGSRKSERVVAKDGSCKDSQDSKINISHLHRMNAKNVSAWNMKRLVNVVRQTGISTLAQTLDETATEENQDTDISSEWQAKAAGKHIFKNVAKPGHKVIIQNDLLRFMREEEAVRAFALFDGGLESGKITKQALKNWVINVYRERRALALSLNDTKTAVNKLHRIIDCLVAILVIIIWLLVLGIATTQLLLFLSSQLLLVVFVFGNTCKTIFEATIFVFVMHPFDVGDRCVVDGVQMVVEEMNILTTVFLRYDNEKIWYPNTVLATKPISNFFRSPNMGDAIEFQISASTPLEKITLLKEKVAKHIKNTPHHWQEKHSLFVKDIVDMNKMNMVLGLGHTMNHQEAGEKWLRRSEMLLQLRKFLQDLGIEYRLLPQEVQVISNGPRDVPF